MTGAVAHLIAGFVGLAGALGGLSAVAYYVGWREETAYYRRLGCSWFVSMLSASNFIQVSVPLLLSICTGVLLTLERISGGRSSQKEPHVMNWIGTAALVGTLILEFDVQKYIGTRATYIVGIVSIVGLGVAAGWLVVDLINRLAQSELKWQAQHLWIVYLLTFYVLWTLPDSIGRLRADGDSDPSRTSLAQISIPQQASNEKWRIVSAVDKEFLVMSTSTDGKTLDFRLIEAKDATSILDNRTR